MARMTATAEAAAHGSEGLRLVGAETQVPVVTGGTRRYVNLDYAASAPALARAPRPICFPPTVAQMKSMSQFLKRVSILLTRSRSFR